MNSYNIIPQYLIDYVKLKRYNKKNYITSSISPEKLYNITSNDLIFLNNIYNLNPKILYNQNLHYENDIYNKYNHNSNIIPIINKLNEYKDRKTEPLYNNLEGYNKFDLPIIMKNKSFGYNYDNFENHFYYIDNDISIPQHTNMIFPESTRLENTINRFNDNFYNK